MVYAASSHQVTQVWIAGRQVIRDRQPVTLEPDAILAATRSWRARIAEG
jgi:5-methylthioadenosine/S-adenosylhomocysteine deaminase